MSTVHWDGKANKNIVDLVRASAPYKAYGQVRDKSTNKVLTVTVYSKASALPVRAVERTDAPGARDRVDIPADELREILRATQDAFAAWRSGKY
ncbi:MAG: hypothetical protein JNL87_23040 [Burkholderiaceae bacterium]|nr:hypothetical protein [Burkholderiaceae bacterium]